MHPTALAKEPALEPSSSSGSLEFPVIATDAESEVAERTSKAPGGNTASDSSTVASPHAVASKMSTRRAGRGRPFRHTEVNRGAARPGLVAQAVRGEGEDPEEEKGESPCHKTSTRAYRATAPPWSYAVSRESEEAALVAVTIINIAVVRSSSRLCLLGRSQSPVAWTFFWTCHARIAPHDLDRRRLGFSG